MPNVCLKQSLQAGNGFPMLTFCFFLDFFLFKDKIMKKENSRIMLKPRALQNTPTYFHQKKILLHNDNLTFLTVLILFYN